MNKGNTNKDNQGNKHNLKRGDNSMEYSFVQLGRSRELCTLQMAVQQFKLKIIESVVKMSTENINSEDKLVGYEALMKEYYINNTDRLSMEAEESLVLSNEAEETYGQWKKSSRE